MQKKATLFFGAHNDHVHSIRIIVKIDKKSASAINPAIMLGGMKNFCTNGTFARKS